MSTSPESKPLPDLESGIPSYEEAFPPPPYAAKTTSPVSNPEENAGTGEVHTQYWIDPSRWRICSTEGMTAAQRERRYWINVAITLFALFILTGIILIIVFSTKAN